MKCFLQIVCQILIAQMAIAQEPLFTINYDELKIDGLNLKLTKNVVLEHFGKPIRTFEPKYECGFLSEREQGEKYYSLQFVFLTFTGNEKEEYILEKIEMNPDLKNKITYKGKELSSKTTKQEFDIMLGTNIEDSLLLYFKNREDGMIFTFKDGFLNKIQYWSPC